VTWAERGHHGDTRLGDPRKARRKARAEKAHARWVKKCFVPAVAINFIRRGISGKSVKHEVMGTAALKCGQHSRGTSREEMMQELTKNPLMRQEELAIGGMWRGTEPLRAMS